MPSNTDDTPQTVAEFVSAIARAEGEMVGASKRLTELKQMADDAGLNRRALTLVANNRHEGPEFWATVGEYLNQIPPPKKERSHEQD